MSGKAVKRADDGSKYNYYYRCTARPGYMQCGKTLVRMNDMHEVVERELRKLMSDRAALLELLAMADEKRPERDKQLAALQDEDKRWLEAYQAGAITASELREYRAELVKKRQALLEVRNEAYPLDDYVRAAATMPIADLLKLTNAVVHVFTDHLEVELGG
jgi:NADH:ubiquinone oxidoreductase subunit E